LILFLFQRVPCAPPVPSTPLPAQQTRRGPWLLLLLRMTTPLPDGHSRHCRRGQRWQQKRWREGGNEGDDDCDDNSLVLNLATASMASVDRGEDVQLMEMFTWMRWKGMVARGRYDRIITRNHRTGAHAHKHENTHACIPNDEMHILILSIYAWHKQKEDCTHLSTVFASFLVMRKCKAPKDVTNTRYGSAKLIFHLHFGGHTYSLWHLGNRCMLAVKT